MSLWDATRSWRTRPAPSTPPSGPARLLTNTEGGSNVAVGAEAATRPTPTRHGGQGRRRQVVHRLAHDRHRLAPATCPTTHQRIRHRRISDPRREPDRVSRPPRPDVRRVQRHRCPARHRRRLRKRRLLGKIVGPATASHSNSTLTVTANRRRPAQRAGRPIEITGDRRRRRRTGPPVPQGTTAAARRSSAFGFNSPGAVQDRVQP